MYQDIAIIGLGTIGGFLSKNLSEIDSIRNLVLIDYDTVEQSNLKNSIYKKSDVGKLKVDCISSVVKKLNENLNVIKINDRYIEGTTEIPKCDLVIDCRDFIYDRGPEISMRLYISSRYLIIDCRKDINYQLHYEGKYIDVLTKSDINSATFNTAWMISNGLITEIIEKNVIHKIELDYLKKTKQETLNDYDNKLEVIMDNHSGCDRFLNFFENAEKILETNRKSEIKVCLGNINDPLNSTTIKKNSVSDVNGLIKCFTTVTCKPYSYNHYIVMPVFENKNYYVVLIPETGAA